MIKTEHSNIPNSSYDEFKMPLPPQYLANNSPQMEIKPIFKDELVQKNNEVYVICQSPIDDLKYPPYVGANISQYGAIAQNSMPLSTIKYCSSGINNNNNHQMNMDRSNLSTSSSAQIESIASNVSTTSCSQILSMHHDSSDDKMKMNAPDTTKKSGARRPEKPAVSYINMIGQAIRESPNRKLTLCEIYAYLQKK